MNLNNVIDDLIWALVSLKTKEEASETRWDLYKKDQKSKNYSENERTRDYRKAYETLNYFLSLDNEQL